MKMCSHSVWLLLFLIEAWSGVSLKIVFTRWYCVLTLGKDYFGMSAFSGLHGNGQLFNCCHRAVRIISTLRWTRTDIHINVNDTAKLFNFVFKKMEFFGLMNICSVTSFQMDFLEIEGLQGIRWLHLCWKMLHLLLNDTLCIKLM